VTYSATVPAVAACVAISSLNTYLTTVVGDKKRFSYKFDFSSKNTKKKDSQTSARQCFESTDATNSFKSRLDNYGKNQSEITGTESCSEISGII